MKLRTRHEIRSCLDGGPDHNWLGGGLDVIEGDLQQTRRCVWCNAEEYRLDGTKRKWRRRKGEAA